MKIASPIRIALPGVMLRLGLVFAAAGVFVFLMNPPDADYARKAFGLFLVFTLGVEYRRSEERDAGDDTTKAERESGGKVEGNSNRRGRA